MYNQDNIIVNIMISLHVYITLVIELVRTCTVEAMYEREREGGGESEREAEGGSII